MEVLRAARLRLEATPPLVYDWISTLFPPPTVISAFARRVSSERGAALALVGLTMVLVLTMAALAVDVGMLTAERTRLQSVADASALAGAALLPVEGDVRDEVLFYAGLNHAAGSIAVDEIVLGHWDAGSGFDPTGNPKDAVAVTVRRTSAVGNPVSTYFARVFGVRDVDIVTNAIATGVPGSGTNAGSRFIVDDEMIDSDIPVIEQLADRYNMDKEEIISDNDGDGFIDLPPGEVLELPTGQVGDEGMFDIDHPEWPFGSEDDPSFEDFLKVYKDGEDWDGNQLIPKRDLDPLLGVSRVDDASIYHQYVNPDFCQISPIYKSDVSALNPVNGVPAVNALGDRRGLLAFKILAVGNDPPGSYLPNLVIEICDPTGIILADVEPGPGVAGIRLRLVH